MSEPHSNKGTMTITPEWKLPLYVVVPIVGLAVVMTRCYVGISNKLDDVVSRPELREYVSVLQRQNPDMNIPDFPLTSSRPVGKKSGERLTNSKTNLTSVAYEK